MNPENPSAKIEGSMFQTLTAGCEVLRKESQAILRLAERLNSDFATAVRLLAATKGCVILTGMGKAGLVGQKIAATLASTGTPSHFLHPAEAVHGDLGRIGRDDVAVILSHSGETEEVLRLLPSLTTWNIPIIAITAHDESSLSRAATVVLQLGRIDEADSLGLAPSSSTTAMLALGDALALVTSREKGFAAQDFATLHPAGSLGRKLAKVDDIMRPICQCRIALESESVRRVLVSHGQTGRRTGAIMLVEQTGCLSGIFTDSDLARLLENGHDEALDMPVSNVMTKSPTTAQMGTLMSHAVESLIRKKISEIPVVNESHHPVGIIDITDVVAYLPKQTNDTDENGSSRAEVKEQEKVSELSNHHLKSA